MRRTFSPNRICERQSVKNRHTGLKISPKRQKKCAYYENCTKPSLQVMSSTVWQNRIFEGQTSENRYTCLKFSSKREKRENTALSNKIVQNVLYRSCAARFGQIAVCRFDLFGPVCHCEFFGPVCHFDSFALIFLKLALIFLKLADFFKIGWPVSQLHSFGQLSQCYHFQPVFSFDWSGQVSHV